MTSIRARLLAYYITVLTIVLTALGLALYFGVKLALQRQLDELLRNHLAWLEGTLEWERRGVEFEWHAEEDTLGGPKKLFWEVRSSGGRMLEQGSLLREANASIPEIGENPPPFPEVAFANGEIAGLGPVRIAEARLQISADDDRKRAQDIIARAAVLRAETEATIAALRRALLVVLPLVEALVIVGGVVLVNRALAPVGAIARTAAAINERNLSERIETTSRDELGQLARTINQMLDRIQDQFERQVRFTADASHELRTPLASLRSGLEVLLRQGVPPVVENELRQCLSTVDSMTRMVERLLLLARADSADLATNFEEIPAATLAATLRDTYEALPGAERVVTVMGEELSGTLCADLELMQCLVVNLVENALVHAGPEAQVTVEFATANGAFTIAVTDNGPGVPPEHQKHLFERFYRVDKARSRERGGAGLGLAICAAVTELHNGEIRYEDAPGGGARFVVTLPLRPDEQPSDGDSPPARPSPPR